MSGHPPVESRHEPRLGNIDAPQDDGLPRVSVGPGDLPPSLRPRRRRRRWLGWLALGMLIAAAVWWNQDRIRAWIPATTLNQLLSRGDLALSEGRLDGGSDSALALYQAASVLAPDNDRPQHGLQAVARAELERGWQALESGRLDEAAAKLTVARQLTGGGKEVDALAQALQAKRGGDAQLAALLDQAGRALAAGRLSGEQSAGELYRHALQLAPDNVVAQHGVDQTSAALATRIRQALAAHQVAAAEALIDQLSALAPHYVELPGLQAHLAETQRQQDAGTSALLEQGRAALRAGRLTGKGKDNALAAFRAVLAIDPQNTAAKVGLGQVSLALIIQAETALDHGDADTAERLLDQASALSPQSTQLAATRARLPHAAAPSKTATGAPAAAGSAASTPTPAGSAARSKHPTSPAIAQLLRAARAAARRGAILLPPGASAYDFYRNALAIDGGNQQALAGLQALPGVVIQYFQQALANGKPAQAASLLATFSELSPGDAALGPLREQLANAWMDSAGQAIESGDSSLASQALGQADRLSPGNPRLQELYVRLRRL